MTKEHSISVKDIIDFLYRSGNLDSRFNAPDLSERGKIGIKAHKKVQKQYEKTFLGQFESEVNLSCIFKEKNFTLFLFGRADGIHRNKKEITVDEIKTTRIPIEDITTPLDENHLRQCMCYGYMILLKENLKKINLRITYYNIDNDKMKHLLFTFSKETLTQFINELITEYTNWLQIKDGWLIKRNQSIDVLSFPFETYRDGQRKLSVMVYHTIKNKKKLFAQAPTGTGKTLATIFPALKAMGKGLSGPLFYFTSKTITRQSIENTLSILRSKGLQLKSIIITAKEKMCINQEFKCNPYHCPFAKGHFDRINEAIKDIVSRNEHYNTSIIQEHAKLHQVCPYELALDLSEFADCIICDYNYLFDPRAYLRRYFEKNGNYTLLIDEAHNLPDRARDMYSSSLSLKRIRELTDILKNSTSKIVKYTKKLETEISYNFLNKGIEQKWSTKEIPEDLKSPLEEVLREMATYLMTPGYDSLKEQLTNFFFELNTFNNAMERYNRQYISIYDMKCESLTLYCVDPSNHIREMLEKGNSCILFSATLSPLDYYKQLFGATKDDYSLVLKSPFNQQKLCLLINSKISTKFKERPYSAESIVENIYLITSHKGNYMIFFPSYNYMEMIYELFSQKYPEIQTSKQRPFMSENEREEFLELFEHSPKSTLVGFVLMGGIFGEGIDLIGSRLSGAVIVGVGLPQIGFDRDIIKNYYQEKIGKGWEYAYVIPGANKVMQAVGRVIRSHEDKGVVMLIDKRFIHKPYPSIFPADWSHAINIRNEKEMRRILEDFWNQTN